MENKNRHKWVAVAVVVAAGCICAVVAARRYCSMCRISYLNLASAASSPKQIATA